MAVEEEIRSVSMLPAQPVGMLAASTVGEPPPSKPAAYVAAAVAAELDIDMRDVAAAVVVDVGAEPFPVALKPHLGCIWMDLAYTCRIHWRREEGQKLAAYHGAELDWSLVVFHHSSILVSISGEAEGYAGAAAGDEMARRLELEAMQMLCDV